MLSLLLILKITRFSFTLFFFLAFIWFFQIDLQPQYYYFGHISSFVLEGAIRVGTEKVVSDQMKGTPSFYKGADIVLFNCNHGFTQQWNLKKNSSGVLQLTNIPDVCVAAPDPQLTGASVQIAFSWGGKNCKENNDYQQWEWKEDGQIQNQATQQCLQAPEILSTGYFFSRQYKTISFFSRELCVCEFGKL